MPSHASHHPAHEGPRAAFTRVLNLGTVAAVFYLAVLFVVSRMAISLHLEAPAELLSDSLRYLRQTLISGGCVLLAIALAEALVAARRLSPLGATALRCAAVALGAVAGALGRLLAANGQIGPQIEWDWFVPTVSVWLLTGGLGCALLNYAQQEAQSRAQLAQAARERDALAAQGVQARLSALQAQIEPHFLFNTLAHVQRLHETDPRRGRDMLRSLIDYLRAALPSMRRSGSTLRRELDLARSFLTILQLRMGDRLVYDIQVDHSLLDAAVPPMVVPTLVENAIKHGLSPLPRGGRIVLSARRSSDGRLEIEVADNGQGFVATSGSGVGLANTRSRLMALFGEQAGLELRSAEPSGVVARVLMPLQFLSDPPASVALGGPA